MLLNALQEKNRELFLEVCVHAAMANKVLEKEEQEIASQTDDAEKRIIALEILGLVKADGRFDGKEKAFFDKLIEGLQIEQDIVSRLESLLERYSAVCKEIYASVYE